MLIGRTFGGVVTAAIALSAVSAGCSAAGGSHTSPPITARVPVPAASTPDWPAPGRDLANSRATDGSSIKAANVEGLQPAWTLTTSGSLPTAPVVVGDTLFVSDSTGSVYAVNRATGATRWRYTSKQIEIGPLGVAVGGGHVYATTGTGVVALDSRTGTVVWTRSLTRTPTEGVDIQPQIAGGLVLVSTVPISVPGQYRGGDRGVIHALDAATGKDVWSFDTIQSKDLWGHPEINSGGGAWYPPAVDTARGLVFYGTANPAPFAGTPAFPNGTSRPGANLYTDSTVALDLATGRLRWYHQEHPHDLFDRDFVHTLLVDRPDGSRIVVGTGKGGVVVAMDELTGKVLWSRAVGVHRNDGLTALHGPTQIYPGTFGGVLTPPAAANGNIYVATNNAPTTLAPGQTSYIGGDLGTHDGEIVAIDGTSGAVIWDRKISGDPLGGAAVVNDLVFTATYQGKAYALDRATGKTVWTFDAGGGINGWMAAAGTDVYLPVSYSSPAKIIALRVR